MDEFNYKGEVVKMSTWLELNLESIQFFDRKQYLNCRTALQVQDFRQKVVFDCDEHLQV